MTRMTMFRGVCLLMSLAVSGIVGCTAFQERDIPEQGGIMREAAIPRPVDKQFPDLPFPPEYELDRERSFIYESGYGGVKVGGLYLMVFNSVDDTVIFYRTEMRNKGWRLIRMINHRGTDMLFEKKALVCNLVIEREEDKTQVVIHIGPK